MAQRHLPSASAPETPRTLRRRTVLATAAAAVPAAGLLGTTAPALADPAVSGGETRVVDRPLAEAPLVDVEGAPGASAREFAEQRGTMLGLTWPLGADAPEVQVRALRASGEWSDWTVLEVAENPETGEDAPGTEVGWLGAFTAVQIRAEIDGAEMSDALVAHVITTSPAAADSAVVGLTADSEMPAAAPERTTMATAAAAAANPPTPTLGPGAPTYVSRAAWGADESLVRGTSATTELKAVVVHHTAGTNSYTSGESAQIVRGILRYHTQSLGWADIGYNLLVSKYGQIFEGRSGGLHRHIVGAHAYGFNTGSFGISVMGDYSSTAPPTAARSAVSRVIGWKLLSTFQEDVTATARWTPGSGTRFPAGTPVDLPRVIGHRDVNYTECPGRAFYDRFSGLRSDAQRAVDSGWKEHLWAYQGAGGRSALGTVVKSAHRTGDLTATILTKGLVLQGSGDAAGYATPFAPAWRSSWGRPARSASRDGDRTIQPFAGGVAALEGGDTRFAPRVFADVSPTRVFFLEIHDLFAAGVTKGWGSGSSRTFRPDSQNLRDAMIVFVYRAMGSPAYTAPTSSPFRDVDPGFVFYREICWAYEEGITRGWGSGADRTFRPLEPVKRDAVAAFLYRAAGSPSASPSGSDMFVDVPRDHTFAAEIGWLGTTGISRGWADGTFRPDAYIKRDQMATFIMRWMAQTGRA